MNIKDDESEVSEPDSHNETQQYIEEIAEEVIERIDTDYIVNDVIESIKEKYHLFKKE